jgi:hypothetical protein
MAADNGKLEEMLQSRLYAALIELAWAQAGEKAAIVERLATTGNQLKDLIMDGKIPEA